MAPTATRPADRHARPAGLAGHHDRPRPQHVQLITEEASVPEEPQPGNPIYDLSVRVRPTDLAWRQAGEEAVVLDVAAARYHGLNASGALLWERLADWTTGGELAAVLAGSFGLTPADAARDVARFLTGCADAGLLEVRAES